MYAHGSTTAEIHPPPVACRRRSITASMRAMMRSESATTLFLAGGVVGHHEPVRPPVRFATVVDVYPDDFAGQLEAVQVRRTAPRAMLGISVICANRIITAVVRSFLSTK